MLMGLTARLLDNLDFWPALVDMYRSVWARTLDAPIRKLTAQLQASHTDIETVQRSAPETVSLMDILWVRLHHNAAPSTEIPLHKPSMRAFLLHLASDAACQKLTSTGLRHACEEALALTGAAVLCCTGRCAAEDNDCRLIAALANSAPPQLEAECTSASERPPGLRMMYNKQKQMARDACMHGRDSSSPCACRAALLDSLLADRPPAHPFTITQRVGCNGGAATVLTRCYLSSTRSCFMLTQKLELGDLSKQVTHVSTAGGVFTVSFERTAESALSLALTCADSSPRPAVMFHGCVMDAAQGCELECFLQESAATWCMGGNHPLLLSSSLIKGLVTQRNVQMRPRRGGAGLVWTISRAELLRAGTATAVYTKYCWSSTVFVEVKPEQTAELALLQRAAMASSCALNV